MREKIALIITRDRENIAAWLANGRAYTNSHKIADSILALPPGLEAVKVIHCKYAYVCVGDCEHFNEDKDGCCKGFYEITRDLSLGEVLNILRENCDKYDCKIPTGERVRVKQS